MHNSLIHTKGFYNHRYCHTSQESRPIKIEFSFEESKPISPLIRNLQTQIRWQSANQPKLKLSNFNERGKQLYMETPKIKENSRISQSAHGGRLNTSEFRATYSRWICSPLQQPINNCETPKGFYTLKYVGEHNDQIGILSKKLSLITNTKKQSKRLRSYTPSIIIDNQFIVNKYIIPRKLGGHD